MQGIGSRELRLYAVIALVSATSFVIMFNLSKKL